MQIFQAVLQFIRYTLFGTVDAQYLRSGPRLAHAPMPNLITDPMKQAGTVSGVKGRDVPNVEQKVRMGLSAKKS